MVLILLNTYPLLMMQDLIFQSKSNALGSSTTQLVSQLAGLETLTEEEVHQHLSDAELDRWTRVLVTDPQGQILLDNREQGPRRRFAFYTELVQALRGQDAFFCQYKDGSFQSRSASPVVYRGQVIGAVYLYDYDAQQGTMIVNLQRTLAVISLLVGLVVLLLVVLLARLMTYRVSRLLDAMETFQNGDYSHRAQVDSRDEIGEIAQKFNDMAETLQKTESARRRFVSDASHELKTPLAAICLLTDSILQSEQMDRETIREFVGDIGLEAERLRRITEKLLQLTRLKTPAIHEPGKVVSVEEILRQTVHTLCVLAEEKQVTLLWRMEEPCYVRDAEDGLQQVIFNLGENAIKYNRPGGFVRILAHREEHFAVLTVEDNGIGIPPEDMPLIFQRFYRVDKSRSPQAGGTGLGLAIVEETVQEMGGRVEVAPRNGGGSVFRVFLPACEQEAES